ncbi:hypothetical protein EMIT0P218_100155 [Pseudomonas sp. IT-P218]
MLAMDVNDDACCLDKRIALKSIASKLAPTEASGFRCCCLVYRNLPSVKNQLVFLLGLE